MRNLTLSLFLLAVAGCAKAPVVSTANLIEQNTQCASPDGWDAVAEHDPDFVVFGELHGTREAPAFFGSLACSLALEGQTLLIAIEFSPYHNDALQKAWNAEEEDFENLLLEAGWRGRLDGVGSNAMFKMVRDLYRLRRAGYVIDITAFNGAGSADQRARFVQLPGQGPHEAAQAENIANAAQKRSYDRVLVLVGNLHAEKQPIDFGTGAFDPMARRLARYGSVVSLNVKYGSGNSWSCQLRPDFDHKNDGDPTDDDIECASHPATATGSFDRNPFISLNDPIASHTAPSFDGFFWLGPITASAPKAPTEDN